MAHHCQCPDIAAQAVSALNPWPSDRFCPFRTAVRTVLEYKAVGVAVLALDLQTGPEAHHPYDLPAYVDAAIRPDAYIKGFIVIYPASFAGPAQATVRSKGRHKHIPIAGIRDKNRIAQHQALVVVAGQNRTARAKGQRRSPHIARHAETSAPKHTALIIQLD